MPNKPSAAKALRQSKKRQERNNAVKNELKRNLKNARRTVSDTKTLAEEELRRTVKLIDKAVRKKVLSKNAAARTKSRLMKKINKSK